MDRTKVKAEKQAKKYLETKLEFIYYTKSTSYEDRNCAPSSNKLKIIRFDTYKGLFFPIE